MAQHIYSGRDISSQAYREIDLTCSSLPGCVCLHIFLRSFSTYLICISKIPTNMLELMIQG